MGGFSSQVQQPQASQPTSGKGGPIQSILPKPNQDVAQPMPVAQPAVMPEVGGGRAKVIMSNLPNIHPLTALWAVKAHLPIQPLLDNPGWASQITMQTLFPSGIMHHSN